MERFPIPIKIKIVDLEPHHRLLVTLSVMILAIGVLVCVQFIADARTVFLPGTTVAGVPVGGLSVEESANILKNQTSLPPLHTVELITPDTTQAVASSSSELGASYAYDDTLSDALIQQQKNSWQWLQKTLFGRGEGTSIAVPLSYSEEKLRFLISLLAQKANQLPRHPSARLGISGQRSSLLIEYGKDAYVVDENQTFQNMRDVLGTNSSETIAVVAALSPISQQLTPEQAERSRERAESLIGERLVFEHDYTKRTLNDAALISLLRLPKGYQLDLVDETLQDWAQELNRAPQNAEFEYDPETLTVSSFVPDRMGLTLDVIAMKAFIEEGLKELEATHTGDLENTAVTKDLALAETAAEKTLANTNDLGINERIGFGESYYYHSIPTRIHNVSHTTNKINLTLVAPGDEFSFNKALGDVSGATGFQPAYIIKDGATILGDGGGVCQVSSTLFRALLDSGLQITRRLPHSYRVSYYELDSQPGFDATVYAGEVDLRFKNDTDHYVLVYGQADSSNLYMFIELYGTSDGRTTEISNYQSWDARPPLPTEYVSDPTLAPGQLKQIDWAASGIKAKFTHTIRDKDGNVMSTKEYVSNYRPWAAKFLQGV